MLKAGKMVLLALLLLGVSGAFSQLHAQEKLFTPIAFQNSSHKCTSLDDYLLTKNALCEDTTLTQVELAVKARAQENVDTTATFSYSTEPTLYIPPTPSVTPTISPDIVPSETPPEKITPTQIPADMVPADATTLNNDLIFDMINAHRTQIGKPAFIKDGALCSLAKERSMELHGELFEGKGYLHSGLYNRNLPYWITEDAKWGSNEAGTVKWWLNSPIHRAAIEGDYTYSCGACNGSMCSQLFTSYTPKG